MKKGLVSIIIVNRNCLKFIIDLLESVNVQTYKNIEVILYDNGSTDGSLEYVIQNCPDIFTIGNSRNIGYSKALNSCIEKSRGEYILVLNTDVIIEPNFIEEMVNAIELNPKIGSAAGKIYRLKDGEKTDIPDCFSHFIRKNRAVVRLSPRELDPNSNLYNRMRFCFGTPASAAMYRRTMLEDIKVGKEIFDEDFFAYWEDVDLDWRAMLRGWRCIYTPKAIAYHARGGSGLLGNKKIASHYLINKFFMIIKNDSFISVLKNMHLVLIKTWQEWMYYAKKDVSIIFIAFFKIPFLTCKMLKKRIIIQKNRLVNQKTVEKWFEDVDIFTELKGQSKEREIFGAARIQEFLQENSVNSILVLHTVPPPTFDNTVLFIKRALPEAKITCLSQPDQIRELREQLGIQDTIPCGVVRAFTFRIKFSLLKAIRKRKFDLVVIPINNLLLTKFKRAVVIALLSGARIKLKLLNSYKVAINISLFRILNEWLRYYSDYYVFSLFRRFLGLLRYAAALIAGFFILLFLIPVMFTFLNIAIKVRRGLTLKTISS